MNFMSSPYCPSSHVYASFYALYFYVFWSLLWWRWRRRRRRRRRWQWRQRCDDDNDNDADDDDDDDDDGDDDDDDTDYDDDDDDDNDDDDNIIILLIKIIKFLYWDRRVQAVFNLITVKFKYKSTKILIDKNISLNFSQTKWDSYLQLK